MLLLGLCAIMSDKYAISSNRESGKGRFNIQLMPCDSSMPGFLIEVKAVKNYSSQKLTELSQFALNQIIDRQYEADMRSNSITQIFKFDIAFSGKEVQISTI